MTEQKKGKSQFKIVRKEGGSRVLTVTDIIPPDWKMVRVLKRAESDEDQIVVILEKVA